MPLFLAVQNQLTPLMYAAMYGHTGILKTLLDAGANLDDVSDDERTALDWAIDCDNNEAVNMLKETLAARA